MLNVALAMALAVAALALLGYLLWLVLRAAGLPIDGFWERWRAARCIVHGQRGDALYRRGDLDGALREYQAAFFLQPIGSRVLATRMANHHTGVLSRLLVITEELQGGTVRLFSLARVDRLLSERGELNRRYLATGLHADRRRRKEIRLQLDANQRELQAALRQLIVEVRAARQPERVH